MDDIDEMTLGDAIHALKSHQCWRMGADIEMLHPKAISMALDLVIEAAERYQFVRTLRPYDFQRITDLVAVGNGRFDDLVDEAMKPKEWAK